MARKPLGPSKKLAIIVLALLALPIGLLAADSRRSIFLGLSGVARHGERFGVTVGEPMSAAADKLLKLPGVELYQRRNGGLCLFRDLPRGHQIDIYADDSWRKGTICVIGRKGRVVEIIWEYQFVSAFP